MSDTSNSPSSDTVQPRARRADAERNREAIVDAALSCLGNNTRASMAEIAAAAGISRVTLYGHFSSRSELVEAVFAHTLRRSEATLVDLELTGDPIEALELLVTESWQTVAASRFLLKAAEDELGEESIRRHHDAPLRRVTNLVVRGQATGAFRNDVPQSWLVACFYAILHGAAEEVRSGRLDPDSADAVVSTTIRSLYRGDSRA